MSKNRVFLRVIVGGYLAYLGAGLVKDAIADKPDNYIMFVGAGVLFLAFGLWWLVKAALMAMRHEYIDPNEDDEDEQDSDEAVMDEQSADDDEQAPDEAASTAQASDEEPAGIEEDKTEQTTDREG